MKYTITAKHLVVSDMSKAYAEKQVRKLDRFLPDFPMDGVTLDIVVEKYHKRSLEGMKIGKEERRGKQVRPFIDHPVYFEVTIKMVLPVKSLVVTQQGKSVDEAMKMGFLKLSRMLMQYKGKHFRDMSEYSDRKTIRKEGYESYT